MQIIVLGMHRSGTSALTRLLSFMGAHIGREDELMPANRSNPAGFWERTDLVELNDQILDSVQVEWNTAIDFDFGKFDETSRDRFTAEARALIERLDVRRPWVIKDPRLCLTFPLWRPLLDDPVVILVHRAPLEVAKSLRARDHFSVPLGVSLWEQHTLLALDYTRGMRRFFVHHQELMADPVATARAIFDRLVDLGVDGLRPAAEKEILSFIDPSLIHEKGDPDLEVAYLNTARKQLLATILDGSVLDRASLPALSPDSRDLIAAHLGLQIAYKSLDPNSRDDLRVMLEHNGEDSGLGLAKVEIADLKRERHDLETRIEDLSEELDLVKKESRRVRGEYEEVVEAFEHLSASRAYRYGRVIAWPFKFLLKPPS